MRRRNLTLTCLVVLFGVPAHAETAGTFTPPALALVHAGCEERLETTAAHHLVDPWYRESSTDNARIRVGTMTHKFARAFDFSADGDFVAIHHDIYPDAEQITVRRLATGEKVSSVLWRGKGDRLFDSRSTIFDGTTGRVVALGENGHTDESDEVVRYDGLDGGKVETREIARIPDHAFTPIKGGRQNHSFHSDLSLEHPYYVRTRARSVERRPGHGYEDEREFAALMVDWTTGLFWRVPNASVNYSSVIPRPFNAPQGYAAVLLEDEVTVELIRTDEIARHVGASAARAGGGWARRWSTKVAAWAGGSSARSNANPRLIHDQPVRKVHLVEGSPLLVTQTAAGLTIWDSRTGLRKGVIEAPIKEVRVLDRLDVLAYTVSGGRLVFYSLTLGREVARTDQFAWYSLNARLVMQRPDRALVILGQGQVLEFKRLSTNPYAKTPYALRPTGFVLPGGDPGGYLYGILTTSKGDYVSRIHHAAEGKVVRTDVFAMVPGGELKTTVDFDLLAFQSQYRLDPTGRTLVYTADETRTGILNLQRLIEARGL